jgi:hypothetical protein
MVSKSGEKTNLTYVTMGRNKQNTLVIIKYPFWQYTYANPDAFYLCINKGEAYCPEEIAENGVHRRRY